MGRGELEWEVGGVVNDAGLEIHGIGRMLEVHIAIGLIDPSNIIQTHKSENNNMVYVSLSFFIY